MQNRYVGDIGDYLKFALLRAVQPGMRMGIAWWLFPNEDHNGDGRHISYLADPRKWRSLDPELFDHLVEVIKCGDRRTSALEERGLLSNAIYASDYIPKSSQERALWLAEIRGRFDSSDIIFFDPDNGLEPSTFNPNSSKSGKSITIGELVSFKRPGRCLIVYHHQTRARGGHIEEVRSWAERLSKSFDRVDVVRCKPYAPRAYFLLDASDEIVRRAERLCIHPGKVAQLNPHLAL